MECNTSRLKKERERRVAIMLGSIDSQSNIRKHMNEYAGSTRELLNHTLELQPLALSIESLNVILSHRDRVFTSIY